MGWVKTIWAGVWRVKRGEGHCCTEMAEKGVVYLDRGFFHV